MHLHPPTELFYMNVIAGVGCHFIWTRLNVDESHRMSFSPSIGWTGGVSLVDRPDGCRLDFCRSARWAARVFSLIGLNEIAKVLIVFDVFLSVFVSNYVYSKFFGLLWMLRCICMSLTVIECAWFSFVGHCLHWMRVNVFERVWRKLDVLILYPNEFACFRPYSNVIERIACFL